MFLLPICQRTASATFPRSGRQAERLADRLLDRRHAMLGAEVDALGDDEFGLDSDHVEHTLEVRLDMLEAGRRRSRAVDTAAGDRDDHALTLGESFGTVLGVAESRTGNDDAVDPRLELARHCEI